MENKNNNLYNKIDDKKNIEEIKFDFTNSNLETKKEEIEVANQLYLKLMKEE